MIMCLIQKNRISHKQSASDIRSSIWFVISDTVNHKQKIFKKT